jgi:hypothetical protein
MSGEQKGMATETVSTSGAGQQSSWLPMIFVAMAGSDDGLQPARLGRTWAWGTLTRVCDIAADHESG